MPDPDALIAHLAAQEAAAGRARSRDSVRTHRVLAVVVFTIVAIAHARGLDIPRDWVGLALWGVGFVWLAEPISKFDPVARLLSPRTDAGASWWGLTSATPPSVIRGAGWLFLVAPTALAGLL